MMSDTGMIEDIIFMSYTHAIRHESTCQDARACAV